LPGHTTVVTSPSPTKEERKKGRKEGKKKGKTERKKKEENPTSPREFS